MCHFGIICSPQRAGLACGSVVTFPVVSLSTPGKLGDIPNTSHVIASGIQQFEQVDILISKPRHCKYYSQLLCVIITYSAIMHAVINRNILAPQIATEPQL